MLKWLQVACLVLLPVLMISNESLWIDEAQTAYHVAQPTLQAWARSVAETQINDSQMPLYMLSAWLGGRIFGMQEWQLRLPNVAYTWLALAAMFLLGRRYKFPALVWLFGLSPFLAFYVNEARPYALVIAASAWLLYGCLMVLETRGGDFRGALILAGASVILCAAHMLGAFLLGSTILVMAYWAWRQQWQIGRRNKLVFAAAFAVLGLLACYYLWTLLRGVGGARLWKVSISSLCFAIYEFLGLDAVGPPRLLLRDILASGQGLPSVIRQCEPYLAGLLAAVILYLALVGGCLARFGRRRAMPELPASAGSRMGPCTGPLLAIVLLTMGSLLLAATAFHWPFWGRHLAMIFPFFICLLVYAGRGVLWQDAPSGQLTWFGLLFLGALGAGVINQRFNPAYARDDYRGAAELARQALASGKTVWWAADDKAAEYYKLQFGRHRDHALVLTKNLPLAGVDQLARPDLIILSKPDIYDAARTLHTYLDQHRCSLLKRLPAFTVWAVPAAG